MRLTPEYSLYGKTKNILWKDQQWYIYKQFKKEYQWLSFQEQQKVIASKIQYFGDYIPETILQIGEDGYYIIKQKYIEGKHLRDVDIKDLSSKQIGMLLDLISCYIRYSKSEGVRLDISWDLGELHWVWSEKLHRNFIVFTKNFLASSNIIVTDEKIYMVDVCEIQARTSILRRAKDFFLKPFVAYTCYRLKSLLSQKK